MGNPYVSTSTLCWNCANATGNCSWSENLIPVNGWKAIYVEKDKADSYIVLECPEFKRDAYEYGTLRTPRNCINLSGK